VPTIATLSQLESKLQEIRGAVLELNPKPHYLGSIAEHCVRDRSQFANLIESKDLYLVTRFEKRSSDHG